MPSRQPRWPSMGLASWCDSTRAAQLRPRRPPSCAPGCLISLSPCGRNSCSGGSSRRMVTGRPSIARKIPLEVVALHGEQLGLGDGAAAWRSPARIISRTASMRSPSKNMCSVRHRPIPSAPNLRATAESCGVSALVRTLRVRNLSAHSISRRKCSPGSGSTVGTRPRITRPVPPSRVIQSPSCTVCPPTREVAARLVHLDVAGAGHAALAHPARHHGGVAGHPPACR